MLSRAEVARHCTRKSCWVIIRDQVYDLTKFLPNHPGGVQAILLSAGKDATVEYESIHPTGTLESALASDDCIGLIGSVAGNENEAQLSSFGAVNQHPPRGKPGIREKPGTEQSQDAKYEQQQPMHISMCLSLDDIEREGCKALSQRAWTYFSSAADDLSSLRENKESWQKVLFVPRVLRNVARVDMRRRLFNFDSSLPFFIAPTAMARLAHPDGELAFVRGATRYNIPYCVSKAASVSHAELMSCAREPQRRGRTNLIFQMYVPTAEGEARTLIRKVKELGYKGLVITVDTAVVGKREEDERHKAEQQVQAGTAEVVDIENDQVDDDTTIERPILRAVSSSTLNWNDLKWIREEWGSDTDSGPLLLKGIQSAADAELATEAGIQHLYLSNHGGRQASSAPSSLLTLVDIRRRCPEILDKAKIYIDGGVRRGADILKALCLGATGVGLGRPFLYGLGAYGIPGVVRVLQLLSDELETNMRLIGIRNLDEVSPDLINTARLERDLQPLPCTCVMRRTSKL